MVILGIDVIFKIKSKIEESDEILFKKNNKGLKICSILRERKEDRINCYLRD
jgi:hypothetical protein